MKKGITVDELRKMLNNEEICPTHEEGDKLILQYAELHSELKDEFYDLLNSDPQFNYKEEEFLDWVIDYVIDI